MKNLNVNVSNEKNVIANKGQKNVIRESKKELSDNELLELNLESLDSDNFDSLISSIKEKAKKEKLVKGEKGKSKMYKIEVDTKIRRKLRNQRNYLLMDIINNANNPKKEIETFEKFYKETYTLNDYSLNSIANENSDKNSLAFVKVGLEIIKRFKSKK